MNLIQKLLDECLGALEETLGQLGEECRRDLAPVREALGRIGAEKDEESFCSNVMALAEAIIQVRLTTVHEELKGLPTPPYDLWLPFKAQDIRPNDSLELGAAMPIWNERIDRLVRLLSEIGQASDDS